MDSEHLNILWTNADPIAAEKMVFMYSINSLKRGWWKEVTLIIWGSTAKLVAEDEHIQEKVKEALEEGMIVSACKACADQLGCTQVLEGLGIEVMYWGEPLTQLIKNESHLMFV
jgi:hypothetical protein